MHIRLTGKRKIQVLTLVGLFTFQQNTGGESSSIMGERRLLGVFVQIPCEKCFT